MSFSDHRVSSFLSASNMFNSVAAHRAQTALSGSCIYMLVTNECVTARGIELLREVIGMSSAKRCRIWSNVEIVALFGRGSVIGERVSGLDSRAVACQYAEARLSMSSGCLRQNHRCAGGQWFVLSQYKPSKFVASGECRQRRHLAAFVSR